MGGSKTFKTLGSRVGRGAPTGGVRNPVCHTVTPVPPYNPRLEAFNCPCRARLRPCLRGRLPVCQFAPLSALLQCWFHLRSLVRFPLAGKPPQPLGLASSFTLHIAIKKKNSQRPLFLLPPTSALYQTKTSPQVLSILVTSSCVTV